jgi:hypothetical protein
MVLITMRSVAIPPSRKARSILKRASKVSRAADCTGMVAMSVFKLKTALNKNRALAGAG